MCSSDLPEVAKAEIAKTEVPKTEAPKAEMAKNEAANAEAVSAEVTKAGTEEAVNATAPVAEASKTETVRTEAPKVELPKVEATQEQAAEAPRPETVVSANFERLKNATMQAKTEMGKVAPQVENKGFQYEASDEQKEKLAEDLKKTEMQRLETAQPGAFSAETKEQIGRASCRERV